MADRLVGEREERLRELERIVRIMDERNTRTGMVRARELIRDLLASSPSPPDREQAVEKMARAILTADDPGLWDALQGDDNILKQQARVEAEAAYEALFGPLDPQCKHDDNPELIWVTRSSLEAVLSSPEREYPAYLVNDGEIVPAFTKAEAEALHKALTLGLTGSYDRLATANDEGLNAARDKLRSLFDSVREDDK